MVNYLDAFFTISANAVGSFTASSDKIFLSNVMLVFFKELINAL